MYSKKLTTVICVAWHLLSSGIALSDVVAGTAKIVDGDTLEIENVTIRLYGIDTPEPAQPFGTEATNALARLAEGKHVRCEGSTYDDFKRLIAVCSGGDVNLNEAQLTAGLAWAFVKYSGDYLPLEQKAREARLGMWQGNPEPPWQFRAKRWEIAVQHAPEGCPIKGNITSHGERIYHVPWSPWYSKTAINSATGERWFCSEVDALAAGWRAPYWR